MSHHWIASLALLSWGGWLMLRLERKGRQAGSDFIGDLLGIEMGITAQEVRTCSCLLNGLKYSTARVRLSIQALYGWCNAIRVYTHMKHLLQVQDWLKFKNFKFLSLIKLSLLVDANTLWLPRSTKWGYFVLKLDTCSGQVSKQAQHWI